MTDNIVKRLRRMAMRTPDSDDATVLYDAAKEIESLRAHLWSLRTLISGYATAADGIVLNWNQDRYGNWVAFDKMHHALLEEAHRD